MEVSGIHPDAPTENNRRTSRVQLQDILDNEAKVIRVNETVILSNMIIGEKLYDAFIGTGAMMPGVIRDFQLRNHENIGKEIVQHLIRSITTGIARLSNVCNAFQASGHNFLADHLRAESARLIGDANVLIDQKQITKFFNKLPSLIPPNSQRQEILTYITDKIKEYINRFNWTDDRAREKAEQLNVRWAYVEESKQQKKLITEKDEKLKTMKAQLDHALTHVSEKSQNLNDTSKYLADIKEHHDAKMHVSRKHNLAVESHLYRLEQRQKEQEQIAFKMHKRISMYLHEVRQKTGRQESEESLGTQTKKEIEANHERALTAHEKLFKHIEELNATRLEFEMLCKDADLVLTQIGRKTDKRQSEVFRNGVQQYILDVEGELITRKMEVKRLTKEVEICRAEIAELKEKLSECEKANKGVLKIKKEVKEKTRIIKELEDKVTRCATAAQRQSSVGHKADVSRGKFDQTFDKKPPHGSGAMGMVVKQMAEDTHDGDRRVTYYNFGDAVDGHQSRRPSELDRKKRIASGGQELEMKSGSQANFSESGPTDDQRKELPKTQEEGHFKKAGKRPQKDSLGFESKELNEETEIKESIKMDHRRSSGVNHKKSIAKTHKDLRAVTVNKGIADELEDETSPNITAALQRDTASIPNPRQDVKYISDEKQREIQGATQDGTLKSDEKHEPPSYSVSMINITYENQQNQQKNIGETVSTRDKKEEGRKNSMVAAKKDEIDRVDSLMTDTKDENDRTESLVIDKDEMGRKASQVADQEDNMNRKKSLMIDKKDKMDRKDSLMADKKDEVTRKDSESTEKGQINRSDSHPATAIKVKYERGRRLHVVRDSEEANTLAQFAADMEEVEKERNWESRKRTFLEFISEAMGALDGETLLKLLRDGVRDETETISDETIETLFDYITQTTQFLDRELLYAFLAKETLTELVNKAITQNEKAGNMIKDGLLQLIADAMALLDDDTVFQIVEKYTGEGIDPRAKNKFLKYLSESVLKGLEKERDYLARAQAELMKGRKASRFGKYMEDKAARQASKARRFALEREERIVTDGMSFAEKIKYQYEMKKQARREIEESLCATENEVQDLSANLPPPIKSHSSTQWEPYLAIESLDVSTQLEPADLYPEELYEDGDWLQLDTNLTLSSTQEFVLLITPSGRPNDLLRQEFLRINVYGLAKLLNAKEKRMNLSKKVIEFALKVFDALTEFQFYPKGRSEHDGSSSSSRVTTGLPVIVITEEEFFAMYQYLNNQTLKRMFTFRESYWSYIETRHASEKASPWPTVSSFSHSKPSASDVEKMASKYRYVGSDHKRMDEKGQILVAEEMTLSAQDNASTNLVVGRCKPKRPSTSRQDVSEVVTLSKPKLPPIGSTSLQSPPASRPRTPPKPQKPIQLLRRPLPVGQSFFDNCVYCYEDDE